MASTGQICSQIMQAMSQGVWTAMVSKSLMKPASCGQMATQTPQLMQAFQEMEKTTGGDFTAFRFF